MVVDWWAHRFIDDPRLKEEVVNDNFEADLAEFEREGSEDWEVVADDKFEG